MKRFLTLHVIVQLLNRVQLFVTPWTACSTPGFPELEIKGDTTTRLFVWPQTKTLTTQNAGKDVQPQELSLIAGRNTKWYSSFWKTIWQFLTRLNITV